MNMPASAASNNTGNGLAAAGISVSDGRLVFDSKTMLDGEYVILVPITQGLGGAAAGAPGSTAPQAAKAQNGALQKANAAPVVAGSSVMAAVAAIGVCVLLL